MKYSLDSDVLIQGWKDYPIGNFPTLWQKIEELCSSGQAKISDLILSEITRGGGDLVDWVKDREGLLVIPTSPEIQTEVQYLVNTYNNFGIITGKNEGDPFVVAVAKAKGCSVVTNERRSGNMNGPKIPDICIAESIRCIRFLDIIKDENFIFQ